MMLKSKDGFRLSRQAWDYLSRGLENPGGKLPVFDSYGQLYPAALIHKCIQAGLAEHWFANPMKPEWMICRLTESGRRAVL